MSAVLVVYQGGRMAKTEWVIEIVEGKDREREGRERGGREGRRAGQSEAGTATHAAMHNLYFGSFQNCDRYFNRITDLFWTLTMVRGRSSPARGASSETVDFLWQMLLFSFAGLERLQPGKGQSLLRPQAQKEAVDASCVEQTSELKCSVLWNFPRL